MKNGRASKIFALAFVILFSLIVIGVLVLSNSKNNKAINYTANIDVDEYGNINVEETLVMNYKTWQNYIIRDIKYNKLNHNEEPYNKYSFSSFNNSEADFDTSSVSVQVYRGNLLDEEDVVTNITSNVDIVYSWSDDPYYKTESGKEKLYDGVKQHSICVDAKDAGRLDGIMTFVYRYQINSMVNTYNDCAELNYIVFNEMDMVVKEALVTVTLPKQVADKNDLRGYGHGLSNGRISITNNQQVDYKAKNVKLYEDFEIRVLFPTGIVNETVTNHVDINILDNILSYESHLALISNISFALNIACIIITVAIFVIMIFVIRHVYIKYDKEFTPDFDGIYLRELPYTYSPAIAGFVYNFGMVKDQDVTGVLLHLIYRGYLTFEKVYVADVKKKDDGVIRVTDKSTGDLLKFERDVYDMFINLIGNGQEVTLSQIENYGKKYSDATKLDSRANAFRNDVTENGRSYNFILNQLKDKAKAARFVFIPILGIGFAALCKVLMQVNVIWEIVLLGGLAFGFSIYTAGIKKRTQVGANHYARWNAFKKFLEDFSNMNDYEIPAMEVWEHYLVYATSLGVADAVMKQLRVKLPEVFDEKNPGYHYYPSYYLYHNINRINHSYTACRANVHNAIAQHNASSGGGHGGGFSSGSSHGGGGGGFHSGR